MRRALTPALLACTVLFWSSRASAQQVLECASMDGTLSHCPVDASGGAFLQRQHSRSACVEGTTWGYDRNGIWVTGGCRATFLVGEPRHSRVAARNAAIAVAALLTGAFVLAARHHEEVGAFEEGCKASREGRAIPDDASQDFRRGHAACDD